MNESQFCANYQISSSFLSKCTDAYATFTLLVFVSVNVTVTIDTMLNFDVEIDTPN